MTAYRKSIMNAPIRDTRPVITKKDIERTQKSLEEARRENDLKRIIFLEATLATYTNGRLYNLKK